MILILTDEFVNYKCMVKDKYKNMLFIIIQKKVLYLKIPYTVTSRVHCLWYVLWFGLFTSTLRHEFQYQSV